MTEYRATPSQWEQVERCAGDERAPWVTAECLLDLRTRLEGLHQQVIELQLAHRAVVDRNTKLDARLREVEALQRRPSSTGVQGHSLFERVRRVIGDNAPCSHSNTRAAMREIASAAMEMHPDANLSWERVAQWLEREALG
jgi:hypothetical protein